MGAFDISRNAFNPAKHFASVRMQQGRVMTDDDWNENERIENEANRRVLTEIVGPAGSPNQGFKIANLRWSTGFVNFDILPGSMYLGGIRLEMEVASPTGPILESFRTQKDWLQHAPNDYPAPSPSQLGTPRYDLVYLEAWQQGVSAVEDNELFEAALAGPDTSTRIRNMRRVHVANNLGFAECAKDWAALCNQWQAAHLGKLNKSSERIVDTRLQVGFTEEGVSDDLCSPSIAGSYLGAENQAIRVQLVNATQFTWGFDNAAPYYRVKMIDPTTVELLDLPKDQNHWPLAGENIELLAWSSLLPNGEKVAETKGHLTKLSGSYDPNTHQVTLNTALPAGFNTNWAGRPDSAEISNDGADTHLYMRVWHRGTDSLSPAAITILPGENVLGNTGLTVTFSGTDRVAGDFWVIAVRPETPSEIMPWRLQHEGMSPHGFRRFFTPLAVIRWQLEGTSGVSGEIIRDCRKTFRPLTQLESCCTIDVGDGLNSFGDFNSIEEALENLPETGGKICVLPGKHFTNARILNRHNITITGCGEQSFVYPKGDAIDEDILFISDSQYITIQNLCFVAQRDRAIRLIDSPAEKPSQHITIRNNSFVAVRNAIYIHTNSENRGENHIYIGYNEIAIPNLESAGVGIFCLADGAMIERNTVAVVPAPAPPETQDNPGGDGTPGVGIFDPCDELPEEVDIVLQNYAIMVWSYLNTWGSWDFPENYLALGGIQIASSSERVAVYQNTIVGGAANGVTLGHLPSILDFGQQNPNLATQLNVVHRNAILANDLDVDSLDQNLRNEIDRTFKGTLYDIQIERNKIFGMGLAGIGVICFFEQSDSDTDFLISVEDLLVDHNRIEKCAQQLPANSRNSIQRGFGGIVLADLERGTIVENLVKDCGKSIEDPICGVYIFSGDNFVISNNRILNNGPEIDLGSLNQDLQASIRQGSRGGIFIAMAFKTNIIDILSSEVVSDGMPAAMIHDNIVVQPLGQALFMMAMGNVSIEGNAFTSQDQDQRNPLSLLAGAVFILNLGISKDLIRFIFEPTLDLLFGDNEASAWEFYGLSLVWIPLQYLPSGQVLFNDNQVTFDQRNLEIDLTISSVAIVTLDDLSFVSNQLECLGLGLHVRLERMDVLSFDYCILDALLAGFSIRTSDNRFQEGYTFTAFSLLSIAMINTTMGNQSSHCLLTYGRAKNVFESNIEGLFENFNCKAVRTELVNTIKGQKKPGNN